MTSLGEALRRNRTLVTLFALMVLLPAAVIGGLIVRSVRGERVRLDYEREVRERQVVAFAEADLSNWLFSAGDAGARSRALLRFEVEGDRIAFPDFEVSLPVAGSLQRPFDATPPDTPLTPQAVADQYLPRIIAFQRDAAAGRNAGAQYFRQLRALVVQPAGNPSGYVVDLRDVVTHVDTELGQLSATDSRRAQLWIAADRSATPPAGAIAMREFPFFAVVFDGPAGGPGGVQSLVPYATGFLVLVTVLGTVFVYRAVANEVRLARLRNDFVAAVSHEFRSPLTSILALVERLDRVAEPERLREYHRLIAHDAHRLNALVARLLDFASMEEGRVAQASDRVDLVAAVRAAIAGCQHVANAERIRLLADNTTPLWVRGDRTALEHAVQNVVENAAKYSPPEAPITVQCATSGGIHVVEVCDRGIGIPLDEQSKIFDRFYRGQQVTAMNVQGVGIGLALVRHVLRTHGGEVVVDSRPGEGSRFTLRLPEAGA